MDVTRRMAHFGATLNLDSVPTQAISIAHSCLIDLIGVTLAGTSEAVSGIVADLARDEGAAPRATVFGTNLRTSVANAAMVNGTTGHALDFDDVSLPMRGHPSVTTGPAVLATAEELGASGADTLAAFVAGVEVTIALAYGVGRSHYATGWHTTSTLGTIGAAVGAARLLGLDTDQTQTAIGIAASMASGLRSNFGTMTKPLHAGHAARNGVCAATLAARGISSNQHVLEEPMGFFELFSRDAEPLSAVSELGQRWSLVDPGINLKRYACCYGTHHAIDGMLELRADYNLNVDKVKEILVKLPAGGKAALIHDCPNTGIQGKFSLPYALSAALIDGDLSLATFTDESVQRPEVQAVFPIITTQEAEGKPIGADDGRYAEVTVRISDGRQLHRRVEHPQGSPQKPMSKDQQEAKFRDCAALFEADRLDGVLVMLNQFKELSDVRSLTDNLFKQT